jgi:outer membrane protein
MVLLLQPLPGATAETVSKSLSLQDCIAIALRNATTVAKSQNNLRLQGSDVLKSYGSFLPKVSVASTYVPYSLNRTYSELSSSGSAVTKVKSSSETLELTLTTSLNLFNGFRDYASLQSAIQREKAAEYTLSRAKQAIVFDITQRYYQVLLDQELLGIAKENLQSARDLLILTDRQFQIGLKSATDLYQQQAEVGNNELSVIRSDNQLRRSKLELLRRLRIEPLSAITLEPVSTSSFSGISPALDLDSLARFSLEHRSDLKASERETQAAEWQITQAAGPRYPRLDLNFNVSTSGVESFKQTIGEQTVSYSYPPLSDQLEGLVGYSLVLSMNWAIFDGFQTSYNIQSAKVNHLNQQLDYQDLKNGIIIDLQQAAGDFSAAFTQIETARINLKAAQSAYDSVQKKYELGASGFVELSTARTVLFNAKSNLTQATYNLALQQSILDFTTGRTVYDEL